MNLYVIFNEETKNFAKTFIFDDGHLTYVKKTTTEFLKEANQYSEFEDAQNFVKHYGNFYTDFQIKEVTFK